MLSRVLVAAALLAGMVACASSRPGGQGQVDATEDGAGDGDGATDQDGATDVDAPVSTGDGGDGPVVDAAIDARPIDAAIDAPIDANTCPTQPCDLHAQCGCTPPLTCDLDFTDLVGTSCRAVNVPGTETSTCNSFSECAAGYVCVGNRCRRYCDMDNDCQQPRGACAIQLTQGTPPMNIPGATTCSSNCEPITNPAGFCPTGMKCGFFEGTNMRDIVDCTTAGAGQHGAACTMDSQCAAGMYCTTYNSLQRCRRICNRTTGGNECAAQAGTSCVGFTMPLTIGATEYGVCAP